MRLRERVPGKDIKRVRPGLTAADKPATPEVQFPVKLLPLMDGYINDKPRSRYYVIHGGRGSAKSWTVARALLLQGTVDPLRVLCAREIMRTIADSVHKLLSDQIKKLGLEGFYQITDNAIRGLNGTEFIFTGLRSLDADKIKSYEGVDVVWVEEAHTVSKRSWQILLPTIRAEGSEIWVTFNPELETDDTFVRFVENAPDNATVIQMNWRDNPWWTPELEAERQYSLRAEPEDYPNIWEGKPRSAVTGAIYPRELSAMQTQGRIRPVPYDPRLRVHAIWDIGWNDQTSIIFAQVNLSEVRIVNYFEGSFLRPDELASIVHGMGYLYGSFWLPHDAQNETLAAGGKSFAEIMWPMLKQKPRIIPRPGSVEDLIRASRLMFPRTYIDNSPTQVDERNGSITGCQRLVECLRRFQRSIPKSTEEPGIPVKNEYRHGADAFGYLATVVDKLTNDEGPRRPTVITPVPLDPGMGY